MWQRPNEKTLHMEPREQAFLLRNSQSGPNHLVRFCSRGFGETELADHPTWWRDCASKRRLT